MPSLLQLRRLIHPVRAAQAGGSVPPWTPLALGLSFWHDATQLALTNGESMSEWPDTSGNGRTKTQASPASQPIYETNAINGLPGVLFDGVDDVMLGVTDATTAFTLWAIWLLPAVIEVDQAVMGDGEGSEGTALSYVGVNGRVEPQFAVQVPFGSEINGDALAGGSAVCLYATADPLSMALRANGIDVPNSEVPGAASTLSAVSSLGACLNMFAGGHVGEAGMVPRVLDGSERALLLAYLSTKWGVLA